MFMSLKFFFIIIKIKTNQSCNFTFINNLLLDLPNIPII